MYDENKNTGNFGNCKSTEDHSSAIWQVSLSIYQSVWSYSSKEKVFILHTSQVTHQVRAYHGSMKQLGSPVPICTPGQREALWE